MNIGDLVMDEWGDLAIIVSQVGSHTVSDLGLRWRLKYIRCGGISTAWGSNLYPLNQKKFQKKLDNSTQTDYIIYTKHKTLSQRS